MTPAKKLALSCLLTVLVGGGLLLWLFFRNDRSAVSALKGKDSVSVVTKQKAIAVDTAKDIAVIKAYYRFVVEDSSTDWDEFEERERKYLTQTLIDKLSLYDESDYLPLLPLSDFRMVSSTIKVLSLGKEWYKVRLFDPTDKEWINIPVRMVTDKDGRRKMGYAIPYGWDGPVSDALLEKHVVKMKEEWQDGQSFLKALFRSYISLNHTIDLDAPSYRKYLCQTFIDKKQWDGDGDRTYFINILDGLWDDSTLSPFKYTITPGNQKGLYRVRIGIERTTDVSDEYLVKLGRRNGHFVITGMDYQSQDIASGGELPQPDGTEDKIYTVVDQMPQFPGGLHALMEYLKNNMSYPKEEVKAGHEGRVVVRFRVNRDGSVSNAEVVRSVAKGLDEEALRVVRSMPDWEPGREDGLPVPVWYSVPVTFKLE